MNTYVRKYKSFPLDMILETVFFINVFCTLGLLPYQVVYF